MSSAGACASEDTQVHSRMTAVTAGMPLLPPRAAPEPDSPDSARPLLDRALTSPDTARPLLETALTSPETARSLLVTALTSPDTARSLRDTAMTSPDTVRIIHDTESTSPYTVLSPSHSRARESCLEQELRVSVARRDLAGVRRLLAEGAPASYTTGPPSQFGDQPRPTPLKQCLDEYYWGACDLVPSIQLEHQQAKENAIIQEMLAAGQSIDKEVLECLHRGETPLYKAIKRGDLKTVVWFVKAGANTSRLSDKGKTALHAAAEHHHILKYFLDNHDIQNVPDDDGYFPIHYAAQSGDVESMKLILDKFGRDQLTWSSNNGSTVWHEIARYNRIETAQYLLKPEYSKYRTSINVVDSDGVTPAYISAYGGHVAMAALLLKNGATLSVNGEKQTAVEQITKQFANPLTFFEDLFDGCVYEKQENCVHVDYMALTDGKGMSQIKVVEELVRCGLSKLLKHPMIESLVYLKWKSLLPVFYFITFIYAVFLVIFNTYVITTFNSIDSSIQPGSPRAPVPTEAPSVESCVCNWVLILFIYILICVLFIEEATLMYLQGIRYFINLRLKTDMKVRLKSPMKLVKVCTKLRLEPCVRLAGLALSAAVPMTLGCAPARAQAGARHAACAALLLAWLQATLLLARFPGWGYYVLMFARVAKNILKILVTSIFLVLGFAICFMIQYHSKSPFNGFGVAFVKTLVMMSSEFDYEGLFDEKHKLEDSRGFVYLLFVMFVIFVAIALMNFMIGVAVSDINELTVIGNIRRLEKQVELLSTLEGLGGTVLGKWSRKLSGIRFHSSIHKNVEGPSKKWNVDFTPRIALFAVPESISYPDYVESFTSELQNDIYNIAKKKRHVSKLDELHDAVETQGSRIKSIENSNKQIKQSIDDLKKISNRIDSIEESNEEIKKSINDLKKDMNKILEIVACTMSPDLRQNIS